jgi:hypothetical protein
MSMTDQIRINRSEGWERSAGWSGPRENRGCFIRYLDEAQVRITRDNETVRDKKEGVQGPLS